MSPEVAQVQAQRDGGTTYLMLSLSSSFSRVDVLALGCQPDQVKAAQEHREVGIDGQKGFSIQDTRGARKGT